MTMSSVESPSKYQPEKASLGAPKGLTSGSSCELKKSDDVLVPIVTLRKQHSLDHKKQDEPISINTIQNIYDPNSNYNKSRVNNRTAYIKLHRHTFSPGSNFTIGKLKEKYLNTFSKADVNLQVENNKPVIVSNSDHNSSKAKCLQPSDAARVIPKTTSNIQNSHTNILTPDKIGKLREKYSPKSFGYPKTKLVLPSKIPVPTPRKSVTKPKINIESVKVKTVTIDEKEKKVPLITEVTANNFEEVQLIYDNIKFAEPEDKHFIVTRSSSEDSVLKVESSLADFIMEKKTNEKKRSNSFRRMLSGGLFGRDKKKQEDDKNKPKKKDNAVFSDNVQNESQMFDRCSSHRHTVDSSYPRHSLHKTPVHNHNSSGPLYYYKPQQQYLNNPGSRNVDTRYTDMKGNNLVRLQQPKQSLEDYVQMNNSSKTNYLNVNKFIDTSSSSLETDSESRNNTYQNALVAQAELRHIRENQNKKNSLHQQRNHLDVNSDTSSSSETFRSTASHNNQKVELVKPKALIPINSGRPLPNPYQTDLNKLETCENLSSKTIERNLDVDSSKSLPNNNDCYKKYVKLPMNVVVEDAYGTVFDSITPEKSNHILYNPNIGGQLSPKSLEASKLKLPSNREKVELQPRIRSPIPQTKISTEKLIATELLRNSRSPSRSPIGGSLERQRTPRLSRNVYENQNARLPNAHSTPKTPSNEYIHLNTATSYAVGKPPLSPRDNRHVTEQPRRQMDSRHITLATIHADATNCQINQPASPLYVQGNTTFKSNNTSRGVNVNQDHTSHISNINHASPSYTTNLKYNVVDDLHDLTVSSPVRQTNTLPKLINETEDPYSTGEKVYLRKDEYRQQQNYPVQHQRDSINSDVSYGTVSQTISIPATPRPQTPQNAIVSQHQRSPEKQHIFQNVEAFYWRELKKLKEKEQHDLLNYRQQQLYLYGYAEEPVHIRRSRSISPTMQRGHRSLSLPRENHQPLSSRISHETIIEGRPLIDKRPITLPTSDEIEYGQIRQNFNRNPNFVRNTFERTTIGPIGRSRYEQPKPQTYVPIFRRGSLTPEGAIPNESQAQANKKVSFCNSFSNWPTKNGFTQSPPTRRVERNVTVDDEVFLPNSSQMQYVENIYMNDNDPALSKNSASAAELQRPAESVYGSAFAKHITVSNKVCDMYGQIHETLPNNRQNVQLPNQNYGQVKQVGYLYGQLQQNPNQQSPIVMRQSFDHLNAAKPNFVRGARLTASVNDMYRRYPVENMNRVEFIRSTVQPPNRPLPPVPERRDSRLILAKRFIRGYPQVSDTESGSEAAEVQRILHIGAKQKGFGAVGK